MPRLTWPQVAAWRIGRHQLEPRAPAGSLLAVAGRLCGLHAQLMSSAELALWARVEDLERGAVQRALWEDRTLVKTWAMRGTLHLLPADELPVWHALLGTSRRYRRPAFWKRCFGITLEELDRLTEAIGGALDGQLMTREELSRAVTRLTGSKAFVAGLAQSGWGTILKPAAFAGRLCFGPNLGQRTRFTRPDTWLAGAPPSVDPKAAASAVTRRFPAAYGPATYHDFARWWGGGGVSIARDWISSLGEEVSAVELDGTEAWMLAADVGELGKSQVSRSVRLLPAFDQYVVNRSRHAEHLLPADSRRRVFRPQGWISPVLLVNGLIRGTWRHEIRPDHVKVAVEPFLKLPGWVRLKAEREAERLAAFFARDLRLTWKN